MRRRTINYMGMCEHLQVAGDPKPTSPQGCEECLREGTRWVHLRKCLDCGHIGCCDSSPRRHATAHYKNSDHPVMQSFEPGEAWKWCFIDNVMG